MMNFQNSGIVILTYFHFETIFDAIADDSSSSEHCETLVCIACM